MADRTSAGARPPRGDDEVFAVQVLRYLDGQATVQDLSELKEALATRPACRTLFVRLCRLHGELCELLAPLRVAATETAGAALPARPPSPRGASESPPGAAAHPTAADAPPAVSVAEPAGGSEPPGPAAPPGRAASPDETIEYARDSDEDTTH